jgi:hypothetical protein
VVLEALPPLPKHIELNDPNDSFLLSLALVGNAEHLVSGDRRAGLLQRGSIVRTRIVSPAAFCTTVL